MLPAPAVQVHCKEEVEEFQRIAAALVVNVGTLTPAWVESMHLAAAAANAAGHPWVLDPVGAGATKFRTQVETSSSNFVTTDHPGCS